MSPLRGTDLTGMKLGRWTVKCLGRPRMYLRGPEQGWICECDCGEVRWVREGGLVGGYSLGCGCGRALTRAARNFGRSRKHGEAGDGRETAEYRIWHSMRQRCSNPRDKGYPYWGARGITVCDRWNDYVRFVADMGRRPSDSHSLDRIDVDGNYEPSNCRWATPTEQAVNRRSTRFIEYGGERLCVSAWARKRGLSVSALWNRIYKGWPIERALNHAAEIQKGISQ